MEKREVFSAEIERNVEDTLRDARSALEKHGYTKECAEISSILSEIQSLSKNRVSTAGSVQGRMKLADVVLRVVSFLYIILRLVKDYVEHH